MAEYKLDIYCLNDEMLNKSKLVMKVLKCWKGV